MPKKTIGELAQPLLESQIELLERKNEDYGSNNLIITGVRGVAVRLMDKVQRLLTLTSEDREAHFESIEDTFKDASNYGVIGQLLQSGALTERGKFIYLAGPIDVEHLNGNAPDVSDWREYMTEELEERGHAVFNPHTAFAGVSFGMAKVITDVNRSAIMACDVMVANLLGAVTLGTAREIEFANSIGKRVIAVIPEGYSPLAIHDLECVYSLEWALKHV